MNEENEILRNKDRIHIKYRFKKSGNYIVRIYGFEGPISASGNLLKSSKSEKRYDQKFELLVIE